MGGGAQRDATRPLVFDAKLTNYTHLTALNNMGIHFITLRKKGKKLIAAMDQTPNSQWKRLHVDVPKRKYKSPSIFESIVKPSGYDGELRQIAMKGTGRDQPSFLITNDFDSAAESIILRYARRWRIENGIAEAVKFFSLNALSSPILIKVHLDVLMTMIAYALYHFLSQRLRGFEQCRATTIFRHFINMKCEISVQGNILMVTFPRRPHKPIIKAAQLDKTAPAISWIGNRRLRFQFR